MIMRRNAGRSIGMGLDTLTIHVETSGYAIRELSWA